MYATTVILFMKNARGHKLNNLSFHDCREHTDSILCLLLTHSNDTVISGSKDNSFTVISLSLGEVLYTKKEHDGPVTALCSNKSGSILATGMTQTLWLAMILRKTKSNQQAKCQFMLPWPSVTKKNSNNTCITLFNNTNYSLATLFLHEYICHGIGSDVCIGMGQFSKNWVLVPNTCFEASYLVSKRIQVHK